MTDRELMQMALNALNNFDKGNHGMRWQVPVIKALRARLAQPEPEPVRLQCVTCGTVYADGVPPQVAQREWVGLNPKEISEIAFLCRSENPSFFAHEVEAKLKEKNYD